MITKDQANIKIHFAGAENLIRSNLILKGAKAHYSLFTIFPFLCDKFGIKHVYQNRGLSYSEVALNNYKNSKHCIQDSGLFSLMFGSYQGKKDETFINKWYDELIRTTSEGSFLGTVVEIDCQKVIGVNKAWEFRERMKNDLPNNRQINVFHKEDGQAGLDRLIEFSDYIAISVPELRVLGQKGYCDKIAHYIKNKKPKIDVHLLGCTENKMLRRLSFCSSADSTSWVSFNKFGWFKYNDGKRTKAIKKSDINKEVLKQKYESAVREIMTESRIKLSESLMYYHCCDLMQLEYLLRQYTVYAGNQN